MIQDTIIKELCETIFFDIRYVSPERLEKLAVAFAHQVHKERVKNEKMLALSDSADPVADMWRLTVRGM